MDKVYIHHHLGLGDHIICCGIIRQFCQIYRKVYLFCKHNNVLNVSFLYRDLTNLILIPISNDNEVYQNITNENILRIGFENVGQIIQKFNVGWDESFYRQINMPFKERWDSFNVLRDSKREEKLFNKLNPDNLKFVLIHSTGSDGVNRINYNAIGKDLFVIEISPTNTNIIFDYLKLIEFAEEIHCIDSSFLHLVDSVKSSTNLFYHKNVKMRNVSESHTQIKKWNII